MKYVSSLFLFSGYFVQLCMDVGLAVYDFRRMSLGAIRCVVLDHFYPFDRLLCIIKFTAVL